MAVETRPDISSAGSLILTPQEAETIKDNFRSTAHYRYASPGIQEEFDNLSLQEVMVWIDTWPGGQTELGESLLMMRARLSEESSPSSR